MIFIAKSGYHHQVIHLRVLPWDSPIQVATTCQVNTIIMPNKGHPYTL